MPSMPGGEVVTEKPSISLALSVKMCRPLCRSFDAREALGRDAGSS